MNFVLISPIAWDNSGGAHRPVQFAQQLAACGHTVTYVEIEKSRATPASANPRVLNFQDLGWEELEIVRAWYGFDYRAPADLAARVHDLVPAGERTIAFISAPFRPALELLPPLVAGGAGLVYDVLDDIAEMRALGTYCYDAAAEDYLAAHADLIVTLSPRLCEKFSKHRNVTLIRDGVDLTPFQLSPREASLTAATLERGALTLGFWGTMWDYNLDVPLLRHVTRARPEWQFHFIGAYDLDPARPSLAAALAAPNVHFHASVPRAQLAEYAKSFDVCLLPTPVTPFNLARDPLKVYEYLACGKPVVATQLEQLANMPYVHMAKDADDFVSKIENAAQTPIDRTQLDAYVREQTWDKRTAQLLDSLAPLAAAPRQIPPPPHGAMPGADSELDRWQAFAQHLERLVADRETHVRTLEQALIQSGLRDKVKRVLGSA